MNFREAFVYFENRVKKTMGHGDSREIFNRIAEHLSGKSGLDLIMNQSFQYHEEDLIPYIQQLEESKPIQYILGYEWFGELKLKVNKDVLIPRPETFELVRWVLEALNEQNANKKILDIGTGSGCMAIWLKIHFPAIDMWAMDISHQALEVARMNAVSYKADIHFIEGDILKEGIEHTRQYDVIMSNPPYIGETEKNLLQKQVLDFEPHQALFVTNHDPLQFYKAILNYAELCLSPQGIIYFELHQDYALDVEALFNQKKWRTELRKDMFGHWRMMKAMRKL